MSDVSGDLEEVRGEILWLPGVGVVPGAFQAQGTAMPSSEL